MDSLSSKEETRVYIFGAGKAGEHAFFRIRERCNVLGFLDNDDAKAGTRVHGKPVSKPEILLEQDYDLVVIASMFHEEIHHQITKMGIPEEQIAISRETDVADPVALTRRTAPHFHSIHALVHSSPNDLIICDFTGEPSSRQQLVYEFPLARIFAYHSTTEHLGQILADSIFYPSIEVGDSIGDFVSDPKADAGLREDAIMVVRVPVSELVIEVFNAWVSANVDMIAAAIVRYEGIPDTESGLLSGAIEQMKSWGFRLVSGHTCPTETIENGFEFVFVNESFLTPELRNLLGETGRRSMKWLLGKTRNEFSQYGEDGVVETILKLLPSRSNWCVEFGAWDGIHLSNSRRLIVEENYRALLIEASAEQAEKLQALYADNDRVVTRHQKVGLNGNDALDWILDGSGVPEDLDFLSIDIDGMDYYVWESLQRFRPKIVCVEFNPTISNEVRFVQACDFEVSQGCSLLSLVELGREKGYEPCCMVGCNVIFLLREYFFLLGSYDNSLAALRPVNPSAPEVFIGYDGSVKSLGNLQYPWHKTFSIELEHAQPLPLELRKYPGNYNRLERESFQALVQYRRTRQSMAGRSDLSVSSRPDLVAKTTLTRDVLMRHLSSSFIETGSGSGGAIQLALDCGFERVISIDVDPQVINRLQRVFSGEIQKGQLLLIQGDSAVDLGGILEDLPGSGTFWLDAHVDHGPSGRNRCPLYQELEAIALSDVKTHKILIDDLSCFGGGNWGGGISEAVVRKKILSINPKYKFSYEDSVVDGKVISRNILVAEVA